MEKTRVIRAVMVKAGQEVKAGDVLFTLGEGSSEEIEALEEKIRNLQNSYNRTAIQQMKEIWMFLQTSCWMQK